MRAREQVIRSQASQSIISALLITLVCACAVQQVRQLDRFKAWAGEGNDAAIVEARVDCDSSDQACAQRHLIRGMACYPQGKQEVEPKLRFQCAIDSEANRRRAQDPSPAKACELLSQASDLLKADSQPGALAENLKQTSQQVESTQRSECST